MSKTTTSQQQRTSIEHTSTDEFALKRTRRRLINRGINVSLMGYDGGRDLFVFDEIG